MFYIKLILTVIILVSIAAYLFFLATELPYFKDKNKTFYFPSKIKFLKPAFERFVEDYLNDGKTEKYNFIELGAGLGKVAYYAAENYAWEKVIAVELNWRLIEFAKLKANFKKTKIDFVKSDIFEYKIPQNSVVYCYFSYAIMTKLYEEGFFKGNILLSLTFELRGVEPTKVYKLDNFQGELYVYDFRE